MERTKYIKSLLFIVFILLMLSCGTLDNSDIPNDATEKPLEDHLKIEEIYFPDPILKSCVDAHEKTYAFEVLTLSCRNMGIADLTGLESFSAITQLLLDRNQIADIRYIGELKELSVLHLGSNEISDISPLANLKDLSTVDLSNNLISDINSLSMLTNLEQLSLFNNAIIDIYPLTSINKLRVFDISLNKVSSLDPLRQNTKINELYLNMCGLFTSDLSPLGNLKDLKFLMMTGNQIQDVTLLKELTNLEGLQLEDNNIVYGVDQLVSLVRIKGQTPYQINLKGNRDISCDHARYLEDELRRVNQESAVNAKYVLSDCN